jgi:hypothetical protein
MICSLNLLSNFSALQGLGCVESDLSNIIMASMGMTMWGSEIWCHIVPLKNTYFLLWLFLYCIHFTFCFIVITN